MTSRIAVIVPYLSFGFSQALAQTHWVGSWAASQQLAEPKNSLAADDLTDVTLRQIVHLSIGGRELRVHLSNRFGRRLCTSVVFTSRRPYRPRPTGLLR